MAPLYGRLWVFLWEGLISLTLNSDRSELSAGQGKVMLTAAAYPKGGVKSPTPAGAVGCWLHLLGTDFVLGLGRERDAEIKSCL